jgi:hypothetical protein
MVTNIQRQPKPIINAVRIGGAMAGPNDDVQFQMPVSTPEKKCIGAPE